MRLLLSFVVAAAEARSTGSSIRRDRCGGGRWPPCMVWGNFSTRVSPALPDYQARPAGNGGKCDADYLVDRSLIELVHPLLFVLVLPGEPPDAHLRRLILLREVEKLQLLSFVAEDNLRVMVKVLHGIPRGRLRVRIYTNVVVKQRPASHRRRRSHWGSGAWLKVLDTTLSLPRWEFPVVCAAEWAWADLPAEDRRAARGEMPSPFRVLQVACISSVPFPLALLRRRPRGASGGKCLNPRMPARLPRFASEVSLPWPWLVVAYALLVALHRFLGLLLAFVHALWPLPAHNYGEEMEYEDGVEEVE